tara:strand:- start:131 stop:889 length:759 start_codon:yes stop_codon:yes gene_type:complete
MLDVLILSLVQGITEFLPISSSSHLILFSRFMNFENQGLTIDVSMHIGSFIAVLTYFYRDIFNFIENKKLLLKIIISSIPIIIVGVILIQTNLIEKLRSLKIIGWMTLLFGLVLFVSDKFKIQKDIKKDFNLKSAIIIGLFQVLSLIPGVSRSGITITVARLLKFKRYDAAKISFLLSIPTLGVVSIYGLNKVISTNDYSFSLLNIYSIILSFIFSLVTIKYFLKYLKSFSLNIFIIYRILLGFIILFFAYL